MNRTLLLSRKMFPLIFISLFLPSCNEKKSSINRESNFEYSEFKYEFGGVGKDFKSCTTGEHVLATKASYCEALRDEDLNNQCGKSERDKAYARDCNSEASVGKSSGSPILPGTYRLNSLKVASQCSVAGNYLMELKALGGNRFQQTTKGKATLTCDQRTIDFGCGKTGTNVINFTINNSGELSDFQRISNTCAEGLLDGIISVSQVVFTSSPSQLTVTLFGSLGGNPARQVETWVKFP